MPVNKKALQSAAQKTKSALSRAEQLGFDTKNVYYHGTTKNFDEFDPNKSLGREYQGKIAGFFSKNPDLANKFVSLGHSGSNVLPVRLKVKNTFDYKNPEHIESIFKELPESFFEEVGRRFPDFNTRKPASKEQLKRAAKEGSWQVLEHPAVVDAIRKQGFDSMTMRESGETNIAVFDPSQIRSKFAQFDPKKAKSGNLLAGVGAVGAGLALANNEAKAGDMPKKLEDLSDEELTAMVAKRQQAELSKLSDEELDALVMQKQEQALAAMSDEELDRLVQAKLGAQGPSTTDTDITAQTLRSALEGQTAGISEPIISGAKAAGAAIPAMFAPSEQLAPEVGPAISRPEYAAELAGKAYEEDVAKRRQFKSDFPLSDIGAQIAGGIVPSPINVGAKIFKGAKMAAGVIPGAGALPSYARLALTGGLGGAGFEATRLGAERPTGFMTEEEAPSIPSALATGAVFGAAPTALVRGAKALPKKALAAMGGVKEQVIDKYLKAAPRLQGAKSQEEVTQLAAQAVEGVKGRAIEGQKLFAEQVNQAIGELSARVSEGSSKSYQILDRSEASVSRDGIVKELNKSLNSFLVGGRPITQAATADYQMIKLIRDNVKELPEMLDAPSVKRLIQQIDGQTNYPTVPGAKFSTPGQRELARVRASIDDVLKTQIPEYRDQMAIVSADTRLLNKMVDEYGGDKAASAVNKLLSAKQASRREEFQRFAAEMGLNLADYLAMQEDAQVFNSYNAMNAGDKVKTLIRGNSESTKEAFKRLSQLSDQDFLQFADDLNVLQSFDKDFTRGSRNVNLWSLIGGAGTAMATGNILFGGSAGAFWGSLVDKYGPAMTRKILDQVSKIQGLPTVQKIQRMELPDSVKQELSRDLIQSVMTLRDHKRPIPVSTDMAALMQDEIKSSDLSTLDKARMLNSLNKDGELIDAEKLFGLPEKKSAEDLAKQRLKQTEVLDLSPAEFMEGR